MSTVNIVRLAKEFVLTFKNKVIARCDNFSLSLGKNVIDVTSFDSDGFEEHISDNRNWSISFGSMVTRDFGTGGATGYGSGVFMTFFDHWASSASDYPVDVILGDTDATAAGGLYDAFAGKGTMTDLSADGAVGEKITYSGTITGSGKLARYTES